MKKDVVILIAEDDKGHYELIKRNLWRSCVENEMVHFKDGQEILDFLFKLGQGYHREDDCSYILLLDIRMPKVDGIEVLRRIKEDGQLKRIPVIMVTTTDDMAEIERCYSMGCSFYIHKPGDYNKFMAAVEYLGGFISLSGLRIPPVA